MAFSLAFMGREIAFKPAAIDHSYPSRVFSALQVLPFVFIFPYIFSTAELEKIRANPAAAFPPRSSAHPQKRMSAIQNLQSFDPFADATKGDDLLPSGTEDYIHIRIQQRNGRKTLTTVQGIADDYDKKKLVKAFKKKFACNGTVIEHPEYGEVIQLQGDQRKNICQFLLEVGIVKEEQLKVHGF
ncbi:Eukaryotic translation initiation factor 1b [Crotalus adamanteus]|uniref:Eukaryotic translation initiation factor 1b n=2 Tax=Crotalus TaxID=8728 RepID=A0AAW1B4B6_CROAD